MCHLHFEGRTMASEFLAFCYCCCWVSTSGTEWSVTAKLPLINGNKNEYGHWFRDIKLIYSHWKWFLFPFEMQLSIQNRSKKGERKGKKPWTTENIFILMCLIHKKSCKIVIIVNKKLVFECDHFALDQFKKINKQIRMNRIKFTFYYALYVEKFVSTNQSIDRTTGRFVFIEYWHSLSMRIDRAVFNSIKINACRSVFVYFHPHFTCITCIFYWLVRFFYQEIQWNNRDW